jgi:hypothetical protein
MIRMTKTARMSPLVITVRMDSLQVQGENACLAQPALKKRGEFFCLAKQELFQAKVLICVPPARIVRLHPYLVV